MKNAVFWDVTLCGYCKSRRLGRTYRLAWYFVPAFVGLLVSANVVPSSVILVTLMIKVISSSETSVLTRATRHNIPGYGILYTERYIMRSLERYELNCSLVFSFCGLPGTPLPISSMQIGVTLTLSVAGTERESCRHSQAAVSWYAVSMMAPPTVAPVSVVVMRRHGTSHDATPSSFQVTIPQQQKSSMVSRLNLNSVETAQRIAWYPTVPLCFSVMG
jgi:hypothetical protein